MRISDVFAELKEDDLTLLYSGTFADTVTTKIINLSNSYFESRPEIAKMHKKTGFLIAECFQNIVRHNESEVENGFFVSRNAHGNLFIASGNVINTDMTSMLANKLDNLNKLSKDELKDIYIQTLTNREISLKGGAGLGLIEMARKTGNTLDYTFENIANGLSYFYFQLRLELPKGDDGNAGQLYELKHTIELRKLLLEEGLLLVYKGDASEETILPMSNMIEQSMSALSNDAAQQKKAFIVLIELLQNMSRHGQNQNGKQEGMFAIGYKNERFTMHASNMLDESKKQKLEQRLTSLSKMSQDGMNEEYKRVLKNGDPENTKGSSLGMIEIARRSQTVPEFSFEPQANGTFLYSVHVEI
ncbi:MAG: SiaB family protein kinase [Vicingaceae bacterium]